MPLVIVYRDPKKVGDEIVLQLRQILQTFVALRLDSSAEDGPDAGLTATDITIIFHSYGPNDVMEKPLQVVIFAGDFHGRATTVNEQAKMIARDIHENVVGNISPYDYFVWIVLGKSGFWSTPT